MGAGIAGSMISASSAQDVNSMQIAYDREKMERSKDIGRDNAAIEMQYARELAGRQESFQREMSSTAYQRSMADMEKAGLNPMLAFSQGGASTPTGSGQGAPSINSSSSGGPSLNVPDYGKALQAIPAGMSMAMDVLSFANQQDKIKAETGATTSVTRKTDADRLVSLQQAKKLGLDVDMSAMDKIVKEAGQSAREHMAPYIPYLEAAQKASSTAKDLKDIMDIFGPYMRKGKGTKSYPGQGGGLLP